MTKINVKAESLGWGISLVSFNYKDRNYLMAIHNQDLQEANFLPNLITEMFGYECIELKGGRGNDL